MNTQEYKKLAHAEDEKFEKVLIETNKAQDQLNLAAETYAVCLQAEKQAKIEKKIKLGPSFDEALSEVKYLWDISENTFYLKVFEDNHVTWRFKYQNGYIKVDFQLIDGEVRIQSRYIPTSIEEKQ